MKPLSAISPRRSLVAFAFAGGLSLTTASAQGVGSVGAVNADTRGTPPGGVTRTIGLGHEVVQRERVVTNADGSAQIAFTDRSAMSIGRNSNVVIDRYVFDPSTGVGEQTASIVKGAMRFVGGQVSHDAGVTIKTPAATIGVRGGVATIALEPGGDNGQRLRVVNHYGTITIQNAAGRLVITRPDAQVLVDGPNSLPRGAGLVDPSYLAQVGQAMTSRDRQRGGAKSPPTNAMVSSVRTRRPAVDGPDIDLPAAGDDVARIKGTPTRSSEEIVTTRPR